MGRLTDRSRLRMEAPTQRIAADEQSRHKRFSIETRERANAQILLQGNRGGLFEFEAAKCGAIPRRSAAHELVDVRPHPEVGLQDYLQLTHNGTVGEPFPPSPAAHVVDHSLDRQSSGEPE